jgi:hypothetical protein
METWTHHGAQITTATGKPVALAHSPDLAPLIASAPDLLAILRRILAAHDSKNNGAVMGEAVLCPMFADIARAAIAKATGGAQ